MRKKNIKSRGVRRFGDDLGCMEEVSVEFLNLDVEVSFNSEYRGLGEIMQGYLKEK